MTKLRFDGQVAIITGAAGALGNAFAVALAERGARILVNDYGGDTFGKGGAATRAEAAAAKLRESGFDAVADATPVGSGENARAIVAAAVKAFGRVDILINNAGIAAPGTLTDNSDEEVETVFRTNLLGPYALMRAAWPHMRKQGYGRILNVSSNSSFGIGGNAPYSTTKSGLLGLTLDAAIEGQPHGIHVNAIMPTVFSRLIEQIPDPSFVDWFRQFFPAHKAAGAALHLLAKTSTSTGLVWAVAGGRTARVTFAEGRGWVNVDADADDIGAHLDTINDMHDAVILSNQAESMAILGDLFRIDGRTQSGLSPEAVLGAGKRKT